VSHIISAASKHDVPELTALRIAVAQGLTRIHGEGPWSACPSRATVLRQLRASSVLVARQGEEIVGTVRLIPANPALFDASAFTPADTALYVIGLAVAERCRGFGVGRELMQVCYSIARAWPAQALWLDTYEHAAGAGRFYEKCGFRKVGVSKLLDGQLGFYEKRVA
jgi:GNAT superfamily N-acetyltransferase